MDSRVVCCIMRYAMRRCGSIRACDRFFTGFHHRVSHTHLTPPLLRSIAMPCNFSDFTDPASLAGWSITSFDWSNSLYKWAAATPMDNDERNLAQVSRSLLSEVLPRVELPSVPHPCAAITISTLPFAVGGTIQNGEPDAKGMCRHHTL